MYIYIRMTLFLIMWFVCLQYTGMCRIFLKGSSRVPSLQATPKTKLLLFSIYLAKWAKIDPMVESVAISFQLTAPVITRSSVILASASPTIGMVVWLARPSYLNARGAKGKGRSSGSND